MTTFLAQSQPDMGDVLSFKRPEPKPKRIKSLGLGYPKPEDEAAAKAIVDAMALHHGLDIEILPEDDAS